MTMITPSYLGETIEYSSLHACRSTLEDPTDWIYQRSAHNRLTCRHSFPRSSDSGKQDLPATPGISMSKDGRWVLPYQTYLPGAGVGGFLDLLKRHGFGDDISDEKFRDPDYLRSAGGLRQMQTIINQLINSYTFNRDLWLDAQDAGLPWAPVRRPEENVGDAHWQQRETFFNVDHAEVRASYTEVGAKWLSPGLPWRNGPAAPLLGEHTAEVLTALDNDDSDRSETKQQTLSNVYDQTISPFGKPWALSGVRVIDLGWILASAGGGRFLAAHGAEVIKVEHSSRIDLIRYGGSLVPEGLRLERDAARSPLTPAPSTSLNRGGNFMEINAGKRAISLNLKSTKGREILKELLKDADILVEGYSPGTMERMGLGYNVLREINPRLIYVQQSGMGETGEYGRIRTFGPTAQAMSGISELSGLPEPYPPAGIGYSYLDWFGAYQIALAMLAGLYRQRTTGEGCWIDSSQVETGIYLTGTAVLNHSVNHKSWSRFGNRSPYKRAAPHGAFRVQGEDRWIAIAAFTDEEWLALVRVLERADLASDQRFVTLELRVAHHDALEAAIDQATQSRDGIELMEDLQRAGVPAGICQTSEDRCEWDPQLRHLGWLTELKQSEIGWWRTKTPPTRFSETPPYQGGIVGRHGPSYGEDNDYVYQKLLGLSDADVAALQQEEVI